MSKTETHACYLKAVVDSGERDYVVSWILNNLPDDDKYDTIVVKGVSGLGIGPIIAYLQKKQLCVIRDHKGKHSSFIIEAPLEITKYIIIDDLTDTGTTIQEISRALKRRYPDAICERVCLYDDMQTGSLDKYI